MAVVLSRKPEMAVAVRAVLGLGHSPESDVIYHPLLRTSGSLEQHFAHIGRLNLFRVAYTVAQCMEECVKLLYSLRVRGLMHPVHKGQALVHSLPRHSLVGSQHELLYHHIRFTPDVQRNANGPAIAVKMYICLRQVEVYCAPPLPLGLEYIL